MEDCDEALTKSLHFKPNNVNSYINRALARININNLRGAMSDYDNALDIDPNNFLAHYNRGLMRVQLGDNNRAIEDFDFVIKMEPKNFMAIFNRALLHDKVGDLKAAIRDYTTVINQFPNFWTGLSYRAGCYRRLGMTAKAELDEFRIFKAQMNKHLGIQPRWSAKTKKAMRKRSEIDPNKYASLVVEDAPKYEHEYKSEYRGKVQNRVVEAGYLPMYQLSYFPNNKSLSSIQAYDKEVDAFNMTLDKKAKHKLYIVCSKDQLNEAESMELFSMIDRLSAELSVAKSDAEKTHLLLLRAVAHSVLRDFEAAIADFTEYVGRGGKSSIAYWQRAVCQTELDEFNLSEGKGITNLHSSEADFSDAIRQNGNNAMCITTVATCMQGATSCLRPSTTIPLPSASTPTLPRLTTTEALPVRSLATSKPPSRIFPRLASWDSTMLTPSSSDSTSRSRGVIENLKIRITFINIYGYLSLKESKSMVHAGHPFSQPSGSHADEGPASGCQDQCPLLGGLYSQPRSRVQGQSPCHLQFRGSLQPHQGL